MNKKLLSTVLGLAAIFTLFIGTPANYAHASEVNTPIHIQEEYKFVTVLEDFKNFPPLQYYFDDGYFRGYIPRVSYDYNSSGGYTALYAGRVYRNSPIEQLQPELQ